MEKEKKEDSLKEEIAKLTKQRTYLWCIVVIIGFFVINQFALMFCSNRILVDQFTFASTISSIILSVIAIIMSVVSGDSINRLLHNFRDLHDEIKDVPDKIEHSVDIMNLASTKFETIYDELGHVPEKIDSSTQSMETVSNRLNLSLDDLGKLIQEIHDKTERMKDELRDEIKDGFKNTVNDASSPSSEGIHIKDIDEFLNGIPYWGKVILYGLKLAKDYKKCFSIDSFCNALKLPESKREYFWGFLMAMKATGIITMKGTGESGITGYNPCLNSLKDKILLFFEMNTDEKRFTSPSDDIRIVERLVKGLADADNE